MNERSRAVKTSRLLTPERLKMWGIVFLIFLLLAVLNFNVQFSEDLLDGKTVHWEYLIVHETTGSFTLIFLLPLLFWFFKRLPLRKKHLLSRIPVYILVSVLFGFSHTMLMTWSRKIIYALAGLGVYDPGRMGYRFLMEYNKQVITFWAICLTFWLIQSIQENQRRRIQAYALEEQLNKARLEALKMQINPHFLFNTLNMISSTMYEDTKAADTMIANLSDLLRVTMDSASFEEHALEQELELIGLYLDIMKARYRSKLSVSYRIDEAGRQALVPGFILQPLVENSIKHGMTAGRKAEIEIIAAAKDGRLELAVEDNGPGLKEATSEAVKNGVGLSNTSERLENLFGRDQHFSLENKPGGGLRAVIDIPLKPSGRGPRT